MNHGPNMFRSIESIQLVTDPDRFAACLCSSLDLIPLRVELLTNLQNTSSTYSRPEMLKPFERRECPGWLRRNNIFLKKNKEI